MRTDRAGSEFYPREEVFSLQQHRRERIEQSYSLGGTINGLTSSGLVLTDGTDTLPISAGSTRFTMPTYIAYGSPYDVTVQGQPSGWTCTASDSSGTMPADNVTDVVITCSTNTYTIG